MKLPPIHQLPARPKSRLSRSAERLGSKGSDIGALDKDASRALEASGESPGPEQGFGDIDDTQPIPIYSE